MHRFTILIPILFASGATLLGQAPAAMSRVQGTSTNPAAIEKKFNDKDARAIRELQLKIADAKLAEANASQEFQQAEAQIKAAGDELRAAIEKGKKDLGCAPCDVSQDLKLIPKAPAPPPAANPK